MSEHIKTGEEITIDVIDHRYEAKFKEKYGQVEWVSLPWLKEQITKIRKEIPLKTSSDWIENSTAKDVLDEIESLLEQEPLKK